MTVRLRLKKFIDPLIPSGLGYRLDDWRRSIRRLVSNKLSLVGLGIVSVFVFTLIFANWIAPYPQDANGAIHFANRFAPHLGNIGLEPMKQEETYSLKSSSEQE